MPWSFRVVVLSLVCFPFLSHQNSSPYLLLAGTSREQMIWVIGPTFNLFLLAGYLDFYWLHMARSIQKSMLLVSAVLWAGMGVLCPALIMSHLSGIRHNFIILIIHLLASYQFGYIYLQVHNLVGISFIGTALANWWSAYFPLVAVKLTFFRIKLARCTLMFTIILFHDSQYSV